MRVSILFSVGLGLLASGCFFNPTVSEYCRLANEECDEEFIGIPVDGVGNGSDSGQVCAVEMDAYLRSLRQNSEEVCHKLADAYEAAMACVIQEQGDCDAFRGGNDCDNEWDDVDDIANDADNRCNE